MDKNTGQLDPVSTVDFAARLKELRKCHNVSQSKLAQHCGIKRQQISNYEVDQSKPSLEIAEKISDFFGVSLDYLLCRSKHLNLCNKNLNEDSKK